tara:strand:- start:1329 stop:1904 length:576 start_codon:yes stop_codon:yes gene_type:complete
MIKRIIYSLFFVISCNQNTTIPISIYTELGPIVLDLYPDKAPITVNNFLKYIDENRYGDFHFYRVVHLENQPQNDIKIEVIQGGLGFNEHNQKLESITHETTEVTKIRHLNGTISMARMEPGTASSEIFICINDQPELDFKGLRNPDGYGFAAFGRVRSGMDIIKRIQTMPSIKQILNNSVKVDSIFRNYQ